MRFLVDEEVFECHVSVWQALPFPILEGGHVFPVPADGYVVAVEGKGPWGQKALTLELPTTNKTVHVSADVLKALAKEDVRQIRFHVVKKPVTQRFKLSVVSDEKYEILLELSLRNASFVDGGESVTFWIAPAERKDFHVVAKGNFARIEARTIAVKR
ncbi:MAG: hypothetical protein QW650_00440 [Thermofilum sp.]